MLSARLAEGSITIVEPIELDEFKTRAMAELFDKLGLGASSVLLVLGSANEKVEISARNLPRVGVIRAEGLNVYDVLRHEKLLVTRAAVAAIEARLARPAKRAAEGAES